MSRASINPSAYRLTMKDSGAVVVIDVDRRGAGRDNGARLAKDDSANFTCDGHS